MKACTFNPIVTLTFTVDASDSYPLAALEDEIILTDMAFSWRAEGRQARIRLATLKYHPEVPGAIDPRVKAECSYAFELQANQLHAFNQYAETLARQLSVRLDRFWLGVHSVSFAVELRTTSTKTFSTLASRRQWAEFMKTTHGRDIDVNDTNLFDL